jgi:hypothetical protein
MEQPQRPLSRLQLDILELEDASWKQPGHKINEFKQRHPGVTIIGYHVALMRLLDNPLAYEHNSRQYAPMLNRIKRLHQEREAARGAHRDVEAE